MERVMSNIIDSKQLSELIMADDDFMQLSSAQDVYCPFEALKVARTEIRHSNFLADILSPNNTHGFGDIILKKFLEQVLGEVDEDILALNLHLTDLSNVEIRREWKNIDLFIRLPKAHINEDLVFAIEIKVESSESKGQLEKYRNIVNEAYPKAKVFFMFLTPTDHEGPSSDKWKHINFETVINAIESGLAVAHGHDTARIMVESYISMLRRRYVMSQELEELANKIWSKHRSALEFLIEKQPMRIDPICEAVFSEEFDQSINKRLAESASELELVVMSVNARSRREWKVRQWERFSDLGKASRTPNLLKIELVVLEKIIAIRLVLCPGDKEIRQKIYNLLDKKDVSIKRRKDKITDSWTRLYSKTIRSANDVSKMIESYENGESEAIEKSIIKLEKDIVSSIVPIILEVNQALEEGFKEGLIK